MLNPNNKDLSWTEYLEMVGSTNYYQEHHKILEKISSNGTLGSDEWNEASAEAIIKAVAAMIEANNTALLTEFEQLRDDS